MRTIVNRLSQSDSAEAWKQVMSVSYSRSADLVYLACYNKFLEGPPLHTRRAHKATARRFWRRGVNVSTTHL
jgi:hypothetical protein